MTSNSPANGCDGVVPLTSQVENCLRSSGYASLRMLKVTQSQDRIHIAGEVPSYYMKQVASVLATAASNLVVHNELIVV
jgi:hypothetical protein